MAMLYWHTSHSMVKHSLRLRDIYGPCLMSLAFGICFTHKNVYTRTRSCIPRGSLDLSFQVWGRTSSIRGVEMAPPLPRTDGKRQGPSSPPFPLKARASDVRWRRARTRTITNPTRTIGGAVAVDPDGQERRSTEDRSIG